MNPGQIMIINEKEAREVLDMPTVISDVESALKSYAEGTCVNPTKLHLSFRPGIEGYMNTMPAYLKKERLMGAKLVTCHRDNPGKFGYPNTMGIVVISDPETGLPFAVVDGTSVTNVRTGAAAGVGAKYFKKKGSHVALSVGAGAQGYMAARAILYACPSVDELRVADINAGNREKFIENIKAEFPNLKLLLYEDFTQAVAGAEIITFAANAPEPLIRRVEVDPGTVVLMMAGTFDKTDFLRFDRCAADFPECLCVRINEELAACHDCGDTSYSAVEPGIFQTTMGEVITGIAPGRLSDDETVIIGMCGMGIEDIKVAKTVYDRVTANGGGMVVDFIDV